MAILPGTHSVTIDSFTVLEDRMIAHMLTKEGQKLQVNLAKTRAAGKSVSLMIFDEFFRTDRKGQRSLRNRHHKRKGQPNQGPKKPNQW